MGEMVDSHHRPILTKAAHTEYLQMFFYFLSIDTISLQNWNYNEY